MNSPNPEGWITHTGLPGLTRLARLDALDAKVALLQQQYAQAAEDLDEAQSHNDQIGRELRVAQRHVRKLCKGLNLPERQP